MTQALALRSVMEVEETRVWSPNEGHRRSFTEELRAAGFEAAAAQSAARALEGADVACSITSSSGAFVTEAMLSTVSHMNVAGSNLPTHAEISAAAVGQFGSVVVDDIAQGKVEYGDLIQAAEAGTFSWDRALELSSVVSRGAKTAGPTLFKSGGVALEDVAVASMLYDKALKSDSRFLEVELA